ncbi:MAG TPA: toxin TcdB middle/N-terminal domain-containing protein, partial [Ktedonobacteraceae bacterium]|nr:toxin TcdB middle/N-terminal domain-containing protein [Ktedonobacteraceae bacterium]
MAGYFPTRFGGMWDEKSFQRYRVAPNFDLKDPEVRLIDLDGDGIIDAIRSGTSLECFFNDPKQGWTGTRLIPRKASLDDFPNVNFSDPRVRWADMTGDGLQDIVLIYDRSISYWPTLGRGKWGQRVCMENSPHLPWGYDPRRILLGDVDGDGVADLVYVEDTHVTLWINQSGNGWSAPIIIEGTPPVFDTDAVRLVDMCGNGVSGILWSADAGELPRSGMFFLDLTGGTKPYLLCEMSNHLGATTRVEYAPSTRFYLADEQRLKTRWKTPLPFPVQVVAKVEVIDTISGGKLTTEYAYHHGYWDGAEREFRGFGRVDQRDTETFDTFHTPGLHGPDQPFQSVPAQMFSPPTETRTWFHQGPIGDEFGEWRETDFSQEFWPGDQQVLSRPTTTINLLNSLPRRARRDALRALRGQVLRSELYALDLSTRQDRPYTITEYLSGIREEDPPAATEPGRLHIFFAHLLAQRTTQWERGSDPMTQFTFTEEYDQYGQACTQIAVAVPRGRDFRVAASPGLPYLATMTRTTYAQRDDTQRYMVDRVACRTTYEITNDGSQTLVDLHTDITTDSAPRQVIGHELSFFDGPAFQGLPLGQPGDYGAPVRTETLVFTQALLNAAYQSGDALLSPPEMPPYLVPDAPPAWSSEYPPMFQALLPSLAEYIYQAGGVSSPYLPGYYAVTEQHSYDFQADAARKGRGQVLVKRDALGHNISIIYDDPYHLLPVQITDSVGLITQATYDYRVLQPNQIIDTNGNRSAYTFTPLGNLASQAVMGKTTEALGDTLAVPGSSFLYDFQAFVDRSQPISVRTIQRTHHVNEASVAATEQNDLIQKIEYSDGLGRLLQTRLQAEDVMVGTLPFGDAGLPIDQATAPGDAVGYALQTTGQTRVVVSGWHLYDNKGQVVKKYEPFFSTSYNYAAPQDAEYGQKAML